MFRAAAIAALCLCPAAAWGSTQSASLNPGERKIVTLSLKPGEFACATATKTGGDLRFETRASGELLQRTVSLEFSRAPVRHCFLAITAQTYEIEIANASKTGVVEMQFSLDEPHMPSERERALWRAQESMRAARRRMADAKKNPQPALDAWQKATAELETTDLQYELATAHRQWGDVFMWSERFPEALEHLSRAAELFDSGGWLFEEALARGNLAYVETRLGDSRAALGNRTAVLEAEERLGDQFGTAITLLGRGEAFWRLGELQQALEDYTRALALWHKLGETRWEATTLNSLGLLNADLGRTTAARANYGAALATWRKLNDDADFVLTKNNIGMLEAARGEYAAAKASFEEVIALAAKLNDSRSRAYALENLGRVYAALSNHEKALELFHESIELKERLNDVQAAAETHREAGLSQFALHHPSEARKEIEIALADSRRIEDRAGEVRSLAALARVLPDAHEAEARIAEAITLVESTRLELRSRDLRASYFSTARDFYDEAIELALKPGGSGAIRAFDWSERGRARTLLDRAGVNPAETEHYAFGAAAIQRDLLDSSTALLEYARVRDRFYAFVATASGLRALDLGPARAIESAEEALTAKLRDAAAGDPSPELARVAKLVWTAAGGPLESSRVTRVVIAAEGGLARVPFAALPNAAGKPLIARFEIELAPSASLVLARRTRPRQTSHDVAVFSNPVFSSADPRVVKSVSSVPAKLDLASLPFSAEESRAIQQAAPEGVRAFSGFGASLENFRTAAETPGAVLHVATHAIIEASDPAASRLVFSLVDEKGAPRRGELRVSGIYAMNVRRDLVVLSACRSAEGPEVRGEGPQSLARAFLYAGGRALVSSLWDVGDSAAAAFMQRFYRAIFEHRLAPSAALRAASLDLRKEGRDIRQWAAFTYSGDWNLR